MVPILRRLDSSDSDILLANCEKLTLGKGESVFKEGDPAKYLYFIYNGEINVFKRLGRDKKISMFTRGNEDCFGEMGVFTGKMYSSSAKTTINSTLYYMEKEMVEKLFEQNGKLGLHFTRWVAESLEASKAKIRDYISFGSEGAVASVFVRYTNMNGIVKKDGIHITKPIKLRDISDHIGISRETVSRVVNQWKKEGIIDNENKHFIIKNMNYFRELLVCENCAVENCVL